MSTTTATRTTRDPGRLLWVVAGVCWLGTLLLLLTGGEAAGHHDVVLTQETSAWPVRLALFLAVWTVMIGAMMLPTTLPVVRLFTAVSARQPRPAPARAAFFAAYLAIWGAFALLALAMDSGVHRLVDHWGWLAEHPQLVLGTTLALAGAYQLSPLKDACLTACRSPLGMVMRHYRRGAAGGWGVGLRHGLTCLGCCWALMLVMFATGVGSLAWMLLLAAVMVAEKTTRWGSRLVTPLGLALIAAGGAVTIPSLVG